jgi:hypothetical protein
MKSSYVNCAVVYNLCFVKYLSILRSNFLKEVELTQPSNIHIMSHSCLSVYVTALICPELKVSLTTGHAGYEKCIYCTFPYITDIRVNYN